MMAGNPSWWSMVPLSQQPSSWLSSSAQSFLPSQYALGSSSLPLNPLPENHELPQPWSQLFFGSFPGDEDRLGLSHYQSKKLENWEYPILNPSLSIPVPAGVKQEVSQNNNLYDHLAEDSTFDQATTPRLPWSQVLPASSPRSCVTSCSNILDFSYMKEDGKIKNPDQSSECNSSATGGMSKKARVQPSASQPPLKVRKEKLGDRITVLHQLVSPFGKTDTASVLLEAIGYIRFLQGQIEALSSPYLGTVSSNIRNQQAVQEERDSVFPEDPGQLLNDVCLKRKCAPSQDSHDTPKDLRSRGLCLVPVTCTQYVGSEIINGAEYWAPAIGGGI